MNHVGIQKRVAVMAACQNSIDASWLTLACAWIFGAIWRLDIDEDRYTLARWRGRWFHLYSQEGAAR